MQPQSAGGFQPDGLAPQRMPGGPPTSGMPFDHRKIGPGGSMGGVMGVPGLGIARQGATGSPSAPLAKGGTPTNELVVYTVVCNKWTNKHYERYYYPGSLMFVQRSQVAGGQTLNVVSLAQLNEMLREGRQILDSQLTTKPRTGFSMDGTPVNEEIVGLKKHMLRYLKEGEAYLTGDARLSGEIAKNKIFRKLICLSLKHIVGEFNYLGEYMSGENYNKPTVMINVGIQGPNNYQPLDNIWGDVIQGNELWLVLKSVKNEDYVEDGSEPEYKYYQFVPRVGSGYPTPDELFFRDPSGRACFGIGIYVGQVLYEPLQYNEEGMRKKMAGLTIGSREAYDFSRKNVAKLVVTLGSSKANLPQHVW